MSASHRPMNSNQSQFSTPAPSSTTSAASAIQQTSQQIAQIQQAASQTLQQYFGFDQFRRGQLEIIQSVLQGKSAAAIFPTGSGKSLCYQIPALLLPNITLVVSPLLALMQDQLSFLQAKGIAAASIDSTQTREQTQQIMRDVQSGQIKVLMISVERLKNERFRNFIHRVPISLLVVDEAHCISEWGHNFRPDYLKLPQYLKEFSIPQALLLTATATPRVIDDMQQKFFIHNHDVQLTGFYRANLKLKVQSVAQHERLETLGQWLSERQQQSGIIYVTQQKTAEDVANSLSKRGISAVAYHAGMGHEQREQIQRAFMHNQHLCIVATIAFGMGIDKSDIRYVVHYDLPKSLENYSQEIGRAGRDGQDSECLMLAGRDNLHLLENYVYGDTPDQHEIAQVIEQIQQCQQNQQRWEIMLMPLSNTTNIRMLPLKTLLVYLELEGIIKPLFSWFAEFRFKLLVDQNQLETKFQGERAEFVRALFSSSSKARVWWTVDFDALHQQYPSERSRVTLALDYFQEQGWIELETKQMTEAFEVLKAIPEPAVLSQRLRDMFLTRQQAEINRLQQMLNLFEANSCLSLQLADYFGQTLSTDCGHCSVCTGQTTALQPPIQLPTLQAANLNKACQPLVEKYRSVFSTEPTATLKARFLSGISSPHLTRIKARQLKSHAELEQYPFDRILTALQQ